MKFKIATIGMIFLLILIYFIGPKPKLIPFDTHLPVVPQPADELIKYISEEEGKHKLKPDNEARIVWFDSARSKTPYSIVYLHGFRASQKEGDPIHRRIAKAFGCNLFLNRLPEHGIDTTDAFIHFTEDKLWYNVREALAIGKSIGEKVIIISTSTGGTASLYLASNFPEDVNALVNMSPNIEINDPSAFILNDHWGVDIAKLYKGSDYMEVEEDSTSAIYWTPKYRIESLAHLEDFVERTMTSETFSKIRIPSLTLYYYKSEAEQDPVLRVDAMLRMNNELATSDSLKLAVAVPTAGAHVMGSDLTSKDVDAVYDQIEQFLIEKVKLRKVDSGTQLL